MRKTITAVVVGLALAASSAFAASPSVADRVGARVGSAQSEKSDVSLPVLLVGAAVLVLVLASGDGGDESESD